MDVAIWFTLIVIGGLLGYVAGVLGSILSELFKIRKLLVEKKETD